MLNAMVMRRLLDLLEENAVFLDSLREAGLDIDDFSIGEQIDLINRNQEAPFCTECLRNTGELIQSVWIPETREFCCQVCGLVITQCRIPREEARRPSPFLPPK